MQWHVWSYGLGYALSLLCMHFLNVLRSTLKWSLLYCLENEEGPLQGSPFLLLTLNRPSITTCSQNNMQRRSVPFLFSKGGRVCINYVSVKSVPNSRVTDSPDFLKTNHSSSGWHSTLDETRSGKKCSLETLYLVSFHLFAVPDTKLLKQHCSML